MGLIDLSHWSLIPGPLANPPADSLALTDIVEYDPAVVAETILEFPGMRLQHPAEPTWWEWVARWEEGERWVELDLTLFDIEPPAWGGSGLHGHCEVTDILGIWMAVRRRVPACWMHNDNCEIH